MAKVRRQQRQAAALRSQVQNGEAVADHLGGEDACGDPGGSQSDCGGMGWAARLLKHVAERSKGDQLRAHPVGGLFPVLRETMQPLPQDGGRAVLCPALLQDPVAQRDVLEELADEGFAGGPVRVGGYGRLICEASNGFEKAPVARWWPGCRGQP